jgi:hypothetical protein
MEVIEQITYLFLLRRLDDPHTLEENKANRLGRPMTRHIFPLGHDAKGRHDDTLRWSRFKNEAPADMFEIVGGPRPTRQPHDEYPCNRWDQRLGTTCTQRREPDTRNSTHRTRPEN